MTNQQQRFMNSNSTQFATAMGVNKFNVRTKFQTTDVHRTTINQGKLIPLDIREIYPGDTVNQSIHPFGRFATQLVPVLDTSYLQLFTFFVPFRLILDDYKLFFGERKKKTDNTDILIPMLNSGENGIQPNSIYDYFGIPPLVPNIEFSELPLRAYKKIWNDWFKPHQMITDEIDINTSLSASQLSDYDFMWTKKRNDYFTSCLPTPQADDPVSLPLGTTAPIIGGGASDPHGIHIRYNDPSSAIGASLSISPTGALNAGNGIGAWAGAYQNWYADLTQSTGINVNDLRLLVQMQIYKEIQARCGQRYIEYVKSFFGVDSDDARLQRPELLGVSKKEITVMPVPQNSSSGNTPQGNLAAFGVLTGADHHVFRSFTEHGYMITLGVLRATQTYDQGLGRFWSRETLDDFYNPIFAHIGEQAVLNKEIYCSGDKELDNQVFGYQQRYSELRTSQDRNSAEFRTSHPLKLSHYHYGQQFANTPVLGDEFLKDNPAIDRTIAVTQQTGPQLLLMLQFRNEFTRCLPPTGDPGQLDHF